MTATLARPPTNGRHVEPEKVGGTFPLFKIGAGISVRLMDITPELAESWLKKNPRVQRNMSQSEVNMLARHNTAGEWMLNGSTIVFDTEDRLCDGQHRLAACVRSDLAITSLVVFGVDPTSFDTMDAGRSRSPRDALKAAGISNQTMVSAACQILYRVENRIPVHSFKSTERVRLSPMEIVQFAKSHKGIEQAATSAAPVARIIHNTGAALACRWLFDRLSRDQAEEFYERLAIGDKLDKGHPVLLLRNSVMPQRRYVVDIMPMMFLAWNAVRKNEPLKKFSFPPTKPLPDLV